MYSDDPELLQAIGEVVVAASRLEYCIARLVELVTGEDLQEILKSTGGASRWLQDMATDWPEDAFGALLRHQQKQVTALLRDRNALVHSVGQWEMTDDDQPTAVWWYPRGGQDLPVTVGTVRELAHALRQATGALARTISQAE